jgi:transposase
LNPPKLSSPAFEALVVQTLDDPEIGLLLRPLVVIAEQIDKQVSELGRRIAACAKASPTCRRLMTVPGVGPLGALTYATGVDEPRRFHNARTVGPHFGLTPRRFQSGESRLVRAYQPRR